MPRKIAKGAKSPVMSEDDNSNKPWVANYPPLKAWLDKHNARCMWQLANPPRGYDQRLDWTPSSYVECWMVNMRPIIVVVHANKHGWEIYTALDTAAIDATLLDVEQRVGLPLTHERDR